MNKVWICCFGLTLLSGPVLAENAQWVEWIGDIELTVGSNDNLNVSAFSNDKEDDNLFRVRGTFGRFYQFNGNTRAHIAVGLASDDYTDVDLMNAITTSLDLGVRHKFGLGFDVPYIQFNINYEDRNVDADLRDSENLTATIEVGKNMTDRFSLAGSVAVHSNDGNAGETIAPVSNEPFDDDFWTASIFADYVLAEDWLLSLDFTRREGDFHSACTPVNVAIVLANEQVQAITLDEAFNGCAYQVDGSANIVSASLGYAISSHSAINVGVQFFGGEADVLSYSGRTFQISYNYRY